MSFDSDTTEESANEISQKPLLKKNAPLSEQMVRSLILPESLQDYYEHKLKFAKYQQENLDGFYKTNVFTDVVECSFIDELLSEVCGEVFEIVDTAANGIFNSEFQSKSGSTVKSQDSNQQ